MPKVSSRIAHAVGAIVSWCSSWLFMRSPVTWIIGSHAAFFSIGSLLAPGFMWFQGLRGVIGLAVTVLCGQAFRHGMSSILMSSPLVALQVYHIPTICAGLYLGMLADNRMWYARLFAGVVFLLACVGFILHPVGMHAWAYTSWWVLGFMFCAIPHRQRFVHACTATLLAHAVGSVGWIWMTHLQSPALWLGLIPIVAVERFAMALGLCLFIEGGEYVTRCVRMYVKNTYGARQGTLA